MTNSTTQFAVQVGDKLLGGGIGDAAAWMTDSVHETAEAALSAAAARRAKRAGDSDLMYRVVRIESVAPYAQTLVDVG